MGVNNISTSLTQPVLLSAQAVEKIHALMCEEGVMSLKLRVYIQGGGCSGFQYGFAFTDQAPEADDAVFETQVNQKDIVTLLVDSVSYPYLVGATIDYHTGMDGEYFSVKNPNAKTTCGCGASFSVDTNNG